MPKPPNAPPHERPRTNFAQALLLALLGTAALLLEPGAGHAAASTAYATAQLDAVVEQWLAHTRQLRPPALSIAVGVSGGLVFARGYGEARPGQPADEHTVYHIGSLSKQFTAAAMLTLVDRGAAAPRSGRPVTLSTPADAFLGPTDAWGDGTVNVRGLLTMTSGIGSFIQNPPSPVDPWGRIAAERLLTRLRQLPLARAASGFRYNNASYFLLAAFIEATASADRLRPGSYAEFVRQEIIAPAGLAETSFVDDDASYRSLSVAVPTWGTTPAYLRHPAYVQPAWLKGAADMASSAADLFAWNRALLDGRILSPASLRLMFSDAARVSRDRYYGMGWFIEHRPGWDWFSHTGFVPGFTSSNMIVRSTDDGAWISVSILVNADATSGLEELSAEVVRTVMRQRIAEAESRVSLTR